MQIEIGSESEHRGDWRGQSQGSSQRAVVRMENALLLWGGIAGCIIM